MAYREVPVFEVREVLRLWPRCETLRGIERLSRVDRKTVRRYVEAAIALGWTARAGRTSSVPVSQRTADLLYALGTEDAYLLFVVECGWSADEWEQWVIDTVSAQVLLPT